MTAAPARLVIGGVSSGVGKTTIALGLARAFRAKGLKVAVFKCGPDYLDPTYLRLASGSPAHNLDGWMMGQQAVTSTFLQQAKGADIAIIEGVMGLFDGASPTEEAGSTAQIAKWLGAPVLLAADVSGMARSIAALAQGFAQFDPDLNVGGLIVNRAGSPSHVDLLKRAQTSPPILGGLVKKPDLVLPGRHLGLHAATASPETESLLSAWGAEVNERFDLDAVLALARTAPSLDLAGEDSGKKPTALGVRCRIGVARDAAFHFYYPDNLRRLEALGVELVPFSPIADAELPKVDGLYIGGGYPELYAEQLAGNRSMRRSVLQFADSERPVYAECGGMMYLTEQLQTLDGRRHEMVGVFDARAVMSPKLKALGYVEATLRHDSILGAAGQTFKGHQFRYSELEGKLSRAEMLYDVQKRRGGAPFAEGYQRGKVVASYVHAHWASNPQIAESWVQSCISPPR